jgi:small GTP-binding protein
LIHNTFLIRTSTLEVLAKSQYWPVEVDRKDLEEFITTREELRKEDTSLADFPLIVGDDKFQARDVVKDMTLVFVTDKGEDESAIADRLESAIKALRKKMVKAGLDEIPSLYESLLEPSIITRLKIALVGEGGVGKTTTLHLLMGDTPPLQYVPTIALNLETVENIRFGNYSLVLWDFAGQERFRNLWKFYFHGADVIFLVCDSSLRNVIISKDILKLIRRDAPKVPVFSLANKQDKPNAMRPEVVQKILGIPTYPMVAIDKNRRDEMLRILMTAAAQFVGVALPDLPASELLKFTDQATAALAEQEMESGLEAPADDEEYEEVYVDEEGNVISSDELGDDEYEYEVIEEELEVEEAGVEAAEEELETSVDEVEEALDEVGEMVAEASGPEALSAEAEGELEFEEESQDETGEMVAEVSPEASGPEVLSAEVQGEPEREEESQIESIGDMAPPTGIGADLEAEIDEDSISPPMVVEEHASITSLADPDDFVDVADEYFPKDFLLGREPADETHKMAKELISEALDADDIISAEIDRVSKDELDVALEAFSSEEVVCPDDETDDTEQIAAEALKELENILGPADDVPADEKDDESDDIDKELDALDELFALMDDDKS